MGRFITPQRTDAKLAAGTSDGDGTVERIVKYAPAEIVSIYVITINALGGAGLVGTTGQYVAIGLIIAFTIGTIAYIWLRAPADQPDVRQKHLLVSPLSFLAWSYPLTATLLGGLFVAWVAVVAQAIVLLLAAIIVPHQK